MKKRHGCFVPVADGWKLARLQFRICSMTELFFINELEEAEIDAERQRVLDLLWSILDDDWVYEVGSTAVEGLIGKQDLDFLVRVPAHEFNHTRQLLDQALDRNPNQLTNDIYQGYMVKSELDVTVQLTVADGPHDTFLFFLRLLRSDPKLRKRYNELKRKFHGQAMTEYQKAKKNPIENTLKTE